MKSGPWQSALERISKRVDNQSKPHDPISVTVRHLLHLLGAPYTTSHIATKRLSRTEREWQCGCHATSQVGEPRIAHWFPCARHELVYLSKAGEMEPTWRERVGPLLTGPVARTWQAPVIAIGIAVLAKSIFDSAVLLKRAEEAEGASLVDPLTGLYNRRGWNRRILEERKRLKRDTDSGAAVFILDVDGLKVTNDERGHSAGDALLRQVSTVIRGVTREHDVAARLGGDEFAILTVKSRAAEADLIRARLDRGFSAEALSVSVGFAYAANVDAIDEAMERADTAMYEVKRKNSANGMRR